jgi:hypothetical protein
MLIAVCPPDSKHPRSLYESTNLDTSALRAILTTDRTQLSSGLWFGGSSANVELVPRTFYRLHYTRHSLSGP